MSDWRDDEARNEARSRDRNEWTVDVRSVSVIEPEISETYICECGDEACRARIDLTRGDYEAVRGYATRFAVAIDHENPEIDRLVSESAGFSVVEKLAGNPARIARETDRRHGGRA